MIEILEKEIAEENRLKTAYEQAKMSYEVFLEKKRSADFSCFTCGGKNEAKTISKIDGVWKSECFSCYEKGENL